MFSLTHNAEAVQTLGRMNAPRKTLLVSKRDTKSALSDAQRAYLTLVLGRDAQKRTLTEIARAGGLNPSTLTRFMREVDHPRALDALTVRRVAEVTGIAPPIDIAGGIQLGLSEDAEPYLTRDAYEMAVIKALIGGRNAADPWRLRTLALEGMGYLPGDVVILDLNATARAGDAVCAQVYDFAGMRAETIWRVFEPPYLVASSADAAFRKPVIVDDDRVGIKGVVVASFRVRKDAA